MSAHIVKDNPNKNALTIALGQSKLDKIGKVVLPRGNKHAADISPMAGEVFEVVGMAARADFFNNDGQDYVTFTSKFSWGNAQDSQKSILDIVKRYISEGQNIVNESKAKECLPVMHFYDASQNPVTKLVGNTFKNAVQPTLEQDGGAMELTNIRIDQSGSINIEVTMLGSCSDCGSAEEVTLNNAVKTVKSALKGLKEKINKPNVQKLHLDGIEQKPAPDGFLMTNKM